MPFTASLGDDRKENGFSACATMIRQKIWDQQPWDVRKHYCLECPFRFTFQGSCSLDFLTVGDTDQFKEEVAACLSWIVENDPVSWTLLNGCVHEVEHAYRRLGRSAPPSPKAVVGGFLETCANLRRDDGFWKDWNYTYVEGFEGKPALKKDLPDPWKEYVEKIMLNLLEPVTYSGHRLLHLYAASSVFEDIAGDRGLPRAHQTFRLIVEACRKAVSARASLEIC